MGCIRTYAVQINLISEGERHPLTTAPEFSVGSWSRVADDVSEAEILLPSSRDCNAFLAQLWPYLGMIEAAIIRDGQLVWAGLITNIATVAPAEPVVIVATDNAYPMQRRDIGSTIDETGDPAQVADTVLNNVLSTPPAPGLDPDPGLILASMDVEDVGESITYEVEDDTTELDAVMDDLTDYGLTWTMVNHRLLIGPRPDEETPLAEHLTEDDFTGNLAYEINLDDVVTYAVATSSDDDTANQTQAVDLPYTVPALGAVIDAGDTTSTATLQTAARRALVWPPRPTLTAQQPGELVADLDINRMIPGRVVWEIQATVLGRPVTERMALESLSVVFHEDGRETISPGLTPLTRVEAQE